MMIIGHRGAAGTAPENTLASFRQAIAEGADWLELDICESKDGQIVVIHDDRLERTTNGRGLVREHTFAQLRRLDAGGWFHRRFAGERIPSLREVVALAGVAGVGLFVEMKPGPHLGRGFERNVVAELERGRMRERAFVISFDHAAVRRLKEFQPRCPTLLLIGRRTADDRVRAAIRAHRADGVAIRHNLCSERLVGELHARGLTVVIWTVNEARAMRRGIRLEVDGIASDYPGRLARVIAGGGRSPLRCARP